MTKRTFFGTDGVRSIAGEFPLTADWTLDLGRAAAEVFKSQSRKPSVVIGKDTRRSGDMLEAALAAGLTSRGVNVIHVGVISTPGVSYLTRHLNATAGVVISASHNPYQDNGIKFFGANGEKLSDALEREIESKIGVTLSPVSGVAVGTVTDYGESERLYTNFLVDQAPDLSGLRIALDCANGATFKIAPRVFQRAGADVFAVYTVPDGKNINLDCGSTHPDHLQRLVREGAYDLGVAFDGDGDRAILVDGCGEIIHGDHMLYITALQRKESTVVSTIMANMGLEVRLRDHGIQLERTDVGDRYVHERLLERGLTLGGEQSGHVLFLDAAPTGDGILTALKTIGAMRAGGKSLQQWREDMPMFPQTLVNVRITPVDGLDKHSIAKHPDVIAAVIEAEKILIGRGRVNLRPSGTESLVRVMVEGPSQDEIDTVAARVADVIRSVGSQA